mgnify:CR=1 FL=1
MSNEDILAQKMFRKIYLLFMKFPRWFRIIFLLGLCALFFPLGFWGAVVIIPLVLVVWVYGSKEALPQRKSFVAHYLTGLPQFSRPINTVNIHIGEYGIKIKPPFMSEVELNYQSITKIEAETKTQITRSASMLKGAAGLVLAGNLGALIGMGIGNKHDDSQYFVSVVYKDELGEDTMLLLQQKEGFVKNLSNAFEIASVMKEARKAYLLKNQVK